MRKNKKWFQLIFKQLQPIHIGKGNYGVINETRIFIPGWTMWGALTKAYNVKKGNDLSKNQELFEEISCFYPCFDKNGNAPLFPEYRKGKFCLGKYSEDEFRARFVDTIVKTAIMPISRMAKDESLYEIDVILPGVRREFCEESGENQVYWTGILKIEDGLKNEFLAKGLKIRVGGDVRYGLGLLELVEVRELDDSNELLKQFKSVNYLSVESFTNQTSSDEDKNLTSINSSVELIIQVKGYRGNILHIENTNKEYCFLPLKKTTSISDLQNFNLKKGILYLDR